MDHHECVDETEHEGHAPYHGWIRGKLDKEIPKISAKKTQVKPEEERRHIDHC